MQLQLSTS